MAQNEGERSVDESTSPTMDAAKKADRAVRDTAQTYLEKFGVKLDPEQIEKSIRDKPLPSVAIAAAAGFIIGGGLLLGWLRRYSPYPLGQLPKRPQPIS